MKKITKKEQAKTYAMVMKQDISEKAKLTRQHQHVAETNNTTHTMPDQHIVKTRPHNTTSATSEELVMECAQPVATETHLLTVQVLCPMCSKENHIHIDKLWQRDGKNRFCRITCSLCKSRTRIGEWSSSQADKTLVQQWLQRHSYNGKTFLKHDTRPPTATVELFRGVAAFTLPVRESESSKRKSQDVKDDDAKRRRLDETQQT